MLRVPEHTRTGYPTAPNGHREAALVWILTVTAVAGAVITGVLASQGELLYAAAFIGLAAGTWALRKPTILLWVSIVGALVVVGAIRLYLPAIQQVRWLLTPISLVLLAHLVLFWLDRANRNAIARVPVVIWWASAFLVLMLSVSLLDNLEVNRFIVGVKGYFQVWGLLFAITFIPWRQSTVDAIPRVLLIIALIQIPFVLHQLLVLVPSRSGVGDGIVAVDVIAGTFGASLEGGGANATLAAFLVMALAGSVSAVQYRIMPAWWLLVLVPMLMFPMLVNMAKVSVLYIFAAFGVLFYRDMLAHPMRFLAAIAGIAALGAALMTAFTLSAPENAGVEDWQSLIEYTYQSNIEEEEVAGQLTRASTLGYWAEEHWPADIMGMLIGHGVGITRVPDATDPFASTVSVSQGGIPLMVDLTLKPGTTSIAAILWEGGVIALILIVGLLVSGYRSAGRSALFYRDIPERAAALRAAQACVVVLFITLFHKNMFVFDVIYQTLLVVIVGYTAYWDRARSGRPILGGQSKS